MFGAALIGNVTLCTGALWSLKRWHTVSSLFNVALKCERLDHKFTSILLVTFQNFSKAAQA